MSKLYEYTGLYKISKTLRFELKPVGKTLENFNKNSILTIDEERELKSKEIKLLLDEYYKIQIDKVLSNKIIDESILLDYIENYKDKNKSDKLEKAMQKIIINEFKSDLHISEETNKNSSLIKTLTSADVFIQLKSYLKNNNRLEDIEKIDFFQKYTTYFTSFFVNRKFIFDSDKTGSISYRLIKENLSIFIENMKTFEAIKKCEVIKLKEEFESMFLIQNYNNYLTQTGIEKYNLILSGRVDETETKEQGLNEIINLFNQANKTKFPLFKILNKQILSDKTSSSFVFDFLEKDKDVYDLIDKYFEQTKFINFFDVKELNFDNIYILNRQNIADLSKQFFDNWDSIYSKLNEWYDSENLKDINRKNYEESRKKHFKNTKYWSINFVSKLMNTNLSAKINELLDFKIESITSALKEYKKLNFNEINNLKTDENSIEIIKNLLDSVKEYQLFLKQFLMYDLDKTKDPTFYNLLDEEYLKIKEINSIYNMVRNYITKKPYDTNKIKLNFNCSTLLDGWDLNKEKNNLGIILKKNNKKTNRYDYFLGILKDKNIFDNIDYVEEDYFEKMEYKLFPGPNKMLPKMFISAKEYSDKLSNDFKNNYNEGKHTKEKLDKKFLAQYIEYMQINLKERYSEDFDFKFRKPADYNQIDEFYREVEAQGYNIKFKNVSSKYIEDCINSDKLYLFRIYSKDFSEFSKGNPNNQTIYFENLFTDDNIRNVVYKLNGQAEMFFRKKSYLYKETHKANEKILNKNPLNKKKESIFDYSIIKNKRYTEDKILFHFPITINFNSSETNNINSFINNNINDFEHVIGIDRGERNLIYVVVTDLKGNIKEQMSLNEIINEHNNNEYKTNYHDLLNQKAKTQLLQKQSWQTIDTIKELKEGYISQVIHKIQELALKYNAFIVLENLSFGFKNSRIMVDKQVYQKFELQLIKKFNYIIDKKNKNTHLKGLQLSNPLNTLDDIGNQSGIIFYTPAWNTSNIDPTTGFVNLIYGLKYKNIEETKNIISKIKDIRFNGQNYEFDIDFKDFNNKYINSKTDWTLYTYGSRIYTKRDAKNNSNFISTEVELTEEFNKLFEEYKIELKNIKVDLLQREDSKLYEKFIFLFKLLLQLRNSSTGINIDYIISPVKNKNNDFFDSRKGNPYLPKDADANGAYNIARKGLMLLETIKNTDPKDKIDYAIKNEEYLINLQNI